MKRVIQKLWLTLLLLMVGVGSAWAETATYTWTYSNSKFKVSSSGTVPSGSSASLVSPYINANQLTGGKTQTFTLKGYDDCTVTGVSINMKRTSSTSAKANITVSANDSQIGSVSNQTLTTSQADYPITVSTTTIGSGKDVVITVNAAANSIYVYNYVITYTPSGKTALSTPTNLSSKVSNVTVDLSWDEVSDASSYKVKIGENEYNASTNSYRAEGLDENTEYSWSVKALSGNSDSYSDGEYSAESRFTTGAFPPVAGTYNIVPNNTFFNCSAFTSKPSNFSNATGSKYGVTIKYNAASNAYINTDQCRAYSGTKLDFTAPAGFALKKIVFAADGTNWAGTHTVSVGTMSSDSKTWEGSASEVAITFGGTCRIKEIAVTYAATKVLQSVAVSGTPTKTTYEAGDNFEPAGLTVTGTYDQGDPEVITEGITWSTPAALTAGQTSVDITATVNGITSSSYTVNGLTVNAPVTLHSIAVTGTPAEFWKGDAFNHDGITVTATWSEGEPTDVTSGCEFSGYDMSAAGQQTVTVTYQGKTDTYGIEVKTIANTQETAYTVAVAKALIDAGKDLATKVYVKGIVSKIVTAWSDQYNNITYSISDDGSTKSQQFQLYRCVTNGAGVGDEVVGYGTLTKYNSTYEFTDGNSLVKVDKVATLSIADITVVDGENIEPVITTNVTGEYAVEYVSDDEDVVLADGDELVTMGTGTATITATLTANGYKTAETTFVVTVTTPQATVTSVTLSGELTNTNYTIGDPFDRSGLVATANYSDDTHVDVTETATWEVDPETLTTAGSVTVTVSASFGGQEDIQEYEVTVNKKTASISFEPATIEVEVNKIAAISAITTPNDAELNYTITEGSEFISIEDGNITGVAEGTATVRADFEGNDEYAAASASLTVNVIPEDPRVTATIGSFSATSGDIDECISYKAFQGDASTAPAIQNNCLRLYQNGGYVTISGIKGVKIQSVRLTTSDTYTSTTVGYCVDGENAPTVGESVSKSSSYTISGLNNQSVSIYCLGTDKNTRLEIAALEVKYIKEDVILKSIAVSGTYETEFIKNSVFNHDGAVVTATFSNGEEEDVTEFADFTAPDMSTTGEKTISISYTYEGVEKTTSYTIHVSEDIVTSIAVTGDYKKTFRTNEEFDHTGVVVTATYISGCKEDVTKDAEFSIPDLTTMGTKTVTVTYAEKTATYDIKVISANAVFYESFDTNVGTGGNDGRWSGSIASNDIKSDNDGWSFVTVSGANQCAKLGSGSKKGSAQTPEISLSGDAKITFKAAAWNGNNEVTTLNLKASSGTLSQPTITMAKGEWTEYTVYLTGVKESTRITFEASATNNNRFFLDEVLVVEYQSTTEQIAISSVGYATYVTTEALDFNNCDGIQAYKVKVDTENSKVRITQVYKVPANTAIVVKGAEAVYDIPTIIYADEDFSDNDLTFSEEKLTVNESFKYYVLANQNGACFAPVKDGAKIAARKGYFVVEGGSSDNASQFRITIEDGSETGIELREDVEDAPVIYNISGQRVESISKSGLFIVNGKKQLRN